MNIMFIDLVGGGLLALVGGLTIPASLKFAGILGAEIGKDQRQRVNKTTDDLDEALRRANTQVVEAILIAKRHYLNKRQIKDAETWLACKNVEKEDLPI